MINSNFFNKKNIFFCFLFFYLILSINNPPFWPSTNLVTFIKNFLGISPFIISIICIAYLSINRSKLTLNLKNLIFLLFIIYNLLQLFPIFTIEKLNTYHSIYWIIAGCSLPLLIISADIIDSRLQEYFFYIALIVFIGFAIIFLGMLLYDTFTSPLLSFSFYGHSVLDPGRQVMDSYIPRSSGLGRLTLIAFLFFHLLYVHIKFNKKIINIFIYLASIFFLFCTFHLQSRIVIGFVLIYFLFNLLPFNKEKFLERFYKLLIVFLLGFLLHLTFPIISGKFKYNILKIDTDAGKIHGSLRMIFINEILKSEKRRITYYKKLAISEMEKITKDPSYKIKNKFVRNNLEKLINESSDKVAKELLKNFLMNNKKFENNELSEILDYSFQNEETSKIYTNKNIFKNYVNDVGIGRMTSDINSTGRIFLWKKALNNLNENLLIGRGPQSDRVFIGENMSNLYMYALFVGGLFSFLSIIIIIFVIIFLCFKETFINLELKNDNNFLKKFSLFCIGFLIIRSIAENSFAVFGIDYILFFLSVSIITTDKKFNFSNR